MLVVVGLLVEVGNLTVLTTKFVLVPKVHDRVARFFSVQNTKTVEKYTKLQQNITNGHKIYQMVVK
jgi:hypothetical protein